MILSEQILKYDSQQNVYPGDDKFELSTWQHKHQQSSDSSRNVNEDMAFINCGLTMEKYATAWSGEFPRLCNSTGEIAHNAVNVIWTTNEKACEMCGRVSVWRCNICSNYLCTTKQQKWNGLKCFFLYQSDEFCRLARGDLRAVDGLTTVSWEPTTEAVMKLNASRIRKLQDKLKKRGEFQQQH